jgi:predicted methyltransferase
MIMGQELNNKERMYDTAAKEYSETFRVLQPGGLVLFTYHIGEDTIINNL